MDGVFSDKMGAQKTIFTLLIVVFITLAIVFAFGNLVLTSIFLGLLFLITFFKSEFYNLLKELGL